MGNSEPRIDISRQKPGTRLLVETEGGVWAMKVVDPTQLHVEVMGTDPRFAKQPAPVLGKFVESCHPESKVGTDGCLIKGQSFSVRFRDAVLVSQPVISVRIEGDNWSYEL